MNGKFPFLTPLLILLLACVSGTVWYLYGSQENTPFIRKLRSAEQPVKMKQCCECHEKVCHQFAGAPHLRTLRKATDADVLDKFAGKEVTLKENGYTYRFYEKEGALWVDCNIYPNPVRIEWVFGSGLHALTPVSLFKNDSGKSELLQHIVSWYPSGKLGVTLGLQELAENTAGIQSLGEVLSHEKTMGCFGCHTSYLGNEPGVIETSQMIAGVSCTRCHLNGEAHIKAVEKGEKDLKLTKWNQLTPLESINRCGECHRRSDQLEPDEIHPSNELLIRFAPIGMSQSPCFIKQGELKLPPGKSSRFDCTTCHDPHEQASRDPEYYREICLNCHSKLEGHAPVCSQESMKSQCLKCHMPAVNVHDNLSFTDHWIRIRELDQQRFHDLKFKKPQ